MNVRADLADCGLYVLSHQFFKFLNHIQKEKPDYGWVEMAEDVIPFMARN